MSEPAASDATSFGGSSDTPCFALLDGRVTNPDTEETSTFRIPLTKLPAVLGRSHETDNPNFFGLGSRKALSRKQCVIYYQDVEGGSVEWDKHSLAYKKKGSWNYKNSKLKTPLDKLPQEGFFVMECLGRNSITVNRQKVQQGESIVLESGSPIRISQHRLYFLLPTDAPPRKHLIQEYSSSSSSSKAKKGIKRPSLAAGASLAKKQKGSGLHSYTESLESMSTKELLGAMTNAIAANTWDRKNQMVGTVLIFRAVKDAARSPEIMELAKGNGVARSRIIEWVEKSAKYKQFVRQLQSKIEPRSYQAAITKAVLKAGYTRNGTAGRYVKWHLPPISDDEEESDQEGPAQDDDDDDDGKEEEEEEEEEEEDDNDDKEDEDDDNDDENDVDMDETENNEADEDEQVDEDEEDEEDEEKGGEEDEQIEEEEPNEMETERPDEGKVQDDDEEGSETNRQEDDVNSSLEENEDGDGSVKNQFDDADEEDKEKDVVKKEDSNE